MISNIRSISKPLQRAFSQKTRQAILQRSTSTNTKSQTHIATTTRSFFSTPFHAEKTTIKVPTMGDSITEGTIVEWVVPVGSPVSEGDVVCLIETDKVTVDIKADFDGVVVQHLGEVEGVVEVGEGLYVLDTDLSAVSATAVAKEEEEAPPAPAVAATAASMEANDAPTSTRVPSIHFLGKEGWEALRKGGGATSPSQSSGTTTTTILSTNTKPQSPTSITYQPYVHMYGRPSITEEEMEALMLGGAEEAPLMKKGAGGAASFYGGKIVTAGPRGVWLAEESM